jgi:hypothetical protein
VPGRCGATGRAGAAGRVRGGGGRAQRRGADAAGHAHREPRRRAQEGRRGGEWEGEGRGERANLGIQNPAITVTESPRAQGGRERGGREGEGVAVRENQMREREREGAWGERGTPGARRAGPGRTGLGWVRLGRVVGRKPAAHTTTDQKPIANRNPSEAKRIRD